MKILHVAGIICLAREMYTKNGGKATRKKASEKKAARKTS
jgi:hypothetical protein